MLCTLPALRRLCFGALLAVTMIAPTQLFGADVVDLAGTWRLTLDPSNAGRAENGSTPTLAGSISLPGSLEMARVGEPVTVETKWTGGIFDRSWFTAAEYADYRAPGNVKVPFWLQPETHYTGAAWYQRDIEIPGNWKNSRVVLTLERPHWKTSVWLDEREIGSSDALSVPHVFDLGLNVTPGRHRLTIRVDNTLDPDIGENSHSVSDHTQGNWNGVAGRIELSARSPVWADAVQIFPDASSRTARVRGTLRNSTGHRARGEISVAIRAAAGATTPPSAPVSLAFDVTGDGQTFDIALPLDSTLGSWDEFSPVTHQLQVTVRAEAEGQRLADEAFVSFGIRDVAARGRQLTCNGRPLFLRGALDCAAFPRTGHPPTDVAAWKREFEAIRAHGLNHVRFHSWCPPEAAFVAADELGVYLQVEVASWPNFSTTLGDGKPVDAWLDAETDRILRTYGNHPSFIVLTACNEPSGPQHETWLSAWITRHKSADPRRLYSAGAGWPEVPENDFHIRSEPRIQHWGEGLASRINQLPPETVSDYRDFINERAAPIVSHEIGQWCVYPNFAEMPKYSGYLKPRNFEIFRDSLAAHGMAEQAHDFLIASGKLQALCYKEDIEAALRTPSMGGFQLLGLSDFPGQGTALVGVLDAFWEEKGYIAPAEFRRFCDRTVPLARLAKRVFTTEEHLVADLEVAHFGAAPLHDATAEWKLIDDAGKAVAHGSLAPRTIDVGAAQPVGRIDLALANIAAPARYKLTVALAGTGAENDWDVWIYPPAATVTHPAPSDVAIVSRLDDAARAKLANGGTVWLMLAPGHVAPDPQRGPVALGFSSIFWNTAWTNGQAPHTLGILCDPKHAALAAFPTDAHSNWQWWYVVTQSSAMILDRLPQALRPTVQVVDDWVTNRKLALAFEAAVGKGKLLVTSIDFLDASLDPVRRQLRASLLAYVASPAFQPEVSVTLDQLAGLQK